MFWPNVGRDYLDFFDEVASNCEQERGWVYEQLSSSAGSSVRQERKQGVVVERLDEVMVEARFLRAAAVLVLAVAGDGDDDGVLAALFPPEPGRDLVAVHAGKPDVEQDEFRA